MIVWIKEWVQGIIVAVIIATILEILLPDNNNKKYINTVIGVYILFSIIAPVISRFTGNGIDIEDYIEEDSSFLASNYTIDNIKLLENNSNVEDIYIKTLKESITNELKKSGFAVNTIELKVDMESENNYGEILGIYLNISCIDEQTTISNIKNVEINVAENENKTNEISSISEGQMNQIKEILMNKYGIDKNKIHIS